MSVCAAATIENASRSQTMHTRFAKAISLFNQRISFAAMNPVFLSLSEPWAGIRSDIPLRKSAGLARDRERGAASPLFEPTHWAPFFVSGSDLRILVAGKVDKKPAFPGKRGDAREQFLANPINARLQPLPQSCDVRSSEPIPIPQRDTGWCASGSPAGPWKGYSQWRG